MLVCWSVLRGTRIRIIGRRWSMQSARVLPGESHVELPAWSPASLLRVAVPQEEGLLVAGTIVLPAGEASGHLEGGDLFRLRIRRRPAEQLSGPAGTGAGSDPPYRLMV